MLTKILPRSQVSSLSACAVAALAFLAMSSAPPAALAGGVESTTCIGSIFRSFSCVRRWGPAGDPYVRAMPAFRDAQEEAEAAERDRRWMAYCRPTIRQDDYGVRRYYYAHRGCEFGRTAD